MTSGEAPAADTSQGLAMICDVKCTRMKRSRSRSLWCVTKGRAVAPPAIMFMHGVSTCVGSRGLRGTSTVDISIQRGGMNKTVPVETATAVHGLHLQEAAAVEVPPDVADDARPGDKDVTHPRICHQVEVSLPIPCLLSQAPQLLGVLTPGNVALCRSLLSSAT